MKLGLGILLVTALASTGCARFASKSTATTTPPTAAQESFAGATAEVRASALPAGKMSARPLARPPGDVRSGEQLAPLNFVYSYEVPHLTTLKSLELQRSHVWTDIQEPNAYCVTTAGEPSPDSFGTTEWSGAAIMALPIANTEAIHAERLDERAGTLTIIDAWVDGSVRGVRPILRRTIPLKQLAEVGGVKLFAFRDVRDDGKSFVQFLVSRPPVLRGSVVGAPLVLGLANGETSEAQCIHARVALPLVAGDSTMASVDVAVEVPAERIQQPDGEHLMPTRARHMRVNVSAMWLARDRDATIDARVTWMGTEQSRIEMRGQSTRQSTVVRNVRGDVE